VYSQLDERINTLGGGAPNKEIEAIIPYKDGILFGGGGSTNSGYLGFWKPGTSSVQTLTDACVFTLYPNPAQRYLNVRGLGNYDYDLVTLKDAGGKVCLQIPLSAVDETTISLPDLPDGVYFTEFSGSRTLGSLQRKVLVMKE